MPRRAIQLASGKPRASLSRVGQRRQVVIPKIIFDELGLVEGDFMEVTAERGRVSMKPKRLIDADVTLTRTEAVKVRRGLKEAREGKTRPWRTIKNELGL